TLFRSSLRIFVICLLALCVAALTLFLFVRIAVHMFLSTFAFSTFAQLSAVGMNQLYFAALANGASWGLFLLTSASFVVLAMLPALAMIRSAPVLGKPLIQSAPRLLA